MRNLPELQFHYRSCREKVDDLLNKIVDAPPSLSCEKCGKSFKVSFALKKHNCKKEEAKKINQEEPELYNYPPLVVKAEFRCLPCATFFTSKEDQKSHKCELKIDDNSANLDHMCKFCKFSFIKADDLKLHYAYAHYQDLFTRWVKAKAFPSKCVRPACQNVVLKDGRELAFHYAITHGKLHKAFEKEKAAKMDDVMKVLCPLEYSRKFENNGSWTSETSLGSSSFYSAQENSSVDEALTKVSDKNKKIVKLSAKNVRCPKCGRVTTESLSIHLCTHYT